MGYSHHCIYIGIKYKNKKKANIYIGLQKTAVGKCNNGANQTYKQPIFRINKSVIGTAQSIG